MKPLNYVLVCMAVVMMLSQEVHAEELPSVAVTGTWGASSLGGHENDKQSLWTYEPGATATWRPQFAEPVRARVWMHIIVYSARNDACANVTIRHGGELAALRVDFTEGETRWMDLGVYDFLGADHNEYVRIRRPHNMNTKKITTRASAVRFDVLDTSTDGDERVTQSLIIDNLTDAEGRPLRAAGNEDE